MEGEGEEEGEGDEGDKLAQKSEEPGVCPSHPGSNRRRHDNRYEGCAGGLS